MIGMNTLKFTLAVVMILTIGVLIIPQTVSLFAGQHYWYNVSQSGNNINCEKCHADIRDELQLSSGPHKSFDCELCHRAYASFAYANGSPLTTDSTKNWEAHAASTVACMLCHQINAQQAVRPYIWNRLPSIPPIAGGFETSSLEYNYTNATYTGINSTHSEFVNEAINSSILEDSNEACLSCHTNLKVEINITHLTGMSITVNNTISGSTSSWNVESLSGNGTITYKVVSNDRSSKGSYGVI